MKLYVHLYVPLVSLPVMLVKLSVRKSVYVKHVVSHNSQSVNITLRRLEKPSLVLGFFMAVFCYF